MGKVAGLVLLCAVGAAVLLVCRGGGLLPATARFLQPAIAASEVGEVYPIDAPNGPAASSLVGWAPSSYVDSGPPLFFVDHERIPGPGLLGRASVSGDIRLFSYLVPAASDPLTFAWVLANTGRSPVRVTVTNFAAAAPGEAYLKLATSVQKAFLVGSLPSTFTVAPGSIHVLRDVSTVPVTSGALVFSIYDLKIAGTLTVMEIGSTDLGGLTPNNLPTQYSAGGGKTAVFPHDARALRIQFSDKAIADIAGGLPDDPGMKAPDQITGATDINTANFGVTYQVSLVFRPGPTRTVNLWISARGCPLAADLRMVGGPLAGKVLQVPTYGTLPVGGLATTLAPLQIPAGLHTHFGFEFLPPSGACTPFVVRADAMSPTNPVVRLYQTAVWSG